MFIIYLALSTFQQEYWFDEITLFYSKNGRAFYMDSHGKDAILEKIPTLSSFPIPTDIALCKQKTGKEGTLN